MKVGSVDSGRAVNSMDCLATMCQMSWIDPTQPSIRDYVCRQI